MALVAVTVAVVARVVPVSTAAVEMVRAKPTGAAYAFLRGIVADAEGLCHLAGGLALKVAEEQGISL